MSECTLTCFDAISLKICILYVISSSTDFVFVFIQIAAIYYLGMAGHFSLGNTNTLATIDVAGAFIVCYPPLINHLSAFAV